MLPAKRAHLEEQLHEFLVPLAFHPAPFYASHAMPNPTDLDGRRAEVWEQLLAIDEDLASLERSELAGVRALDARIQVVVDRLKRQRKSFERQLAQMIPTILLNNRPDVTGDELEWSVTEEQLTKYKNELSTCADEWTNEYLAQFDNEIRNALSSAGVTAPDAPTVSTKAPTKREVRWPQAPVKPVTLPSTFEIILKFWGTHKDLSLVPAASIGLVYFAEAAPWTEPISKMLATAGSVIILPLLVWLGYNVAEKERRKLIREARDAHDAAVIAFAKEEVADALQAHEEALARWVHARAEAWRQTLIAHNDAAYYEIHRKHFQDRRRELRLAKKRMEEKDRELSNAKA